MQNRLHAWRQLKEDCNSEVKDDRDLPKGSDKPGVSGKEADPVALEGRINSFLVLVWVVGCMVTQVSQEVR